VLKIELLEKDSTEEGFSHVTAFRPADFPLRKWI
jgi:hypothetical protein